MEILFIQGVLCAKSVDGLLTGHIAQVACLPLVALEADVVEVVDLTLAIYKVRDVDVGIVGYHYVTDVENYVFNHFYKFLSLVKCVF